MALQRVYSKQEAGERVHKASMLMARLRKAVARMPRETPQQTTMRMLANYLGMNTIHRITDFTQAVRDLLTM